MPIKEGLIKAKNLKTDLFIQNPSFYLCLSLALVGIRQLFWPSCWPISVFVFRY